MKTKKILIVDDETLSKESKQGFLYSINLLEENAIFAHNYEQAKQIIHSRKDIVFCLLDCYIPRSEQSSDPSLDLKNPDFVYYGIRLIPELQNVPTCIYSAYADEPLLKKQAREYPNTIIKWAKRPFKKTVQEEVCDYFNKLLAIPTFEENHEVLHFDYNFLPLEDKLFVCDRAQKIKHLRNRAVRDLIDIGTYLIEVKEKLEHGQFENWIEIEFGMHRETAKRCMAVSRRFKSNKLFDLVDLEKIAISASYVLASATTPQKALEEAVDRIKKGEIISHSKAIELRKKYLDKSNKNRKNPTQLDVKKEEIEADLLEMVEVDKSEKNITETSTIEPIEIEAKTIAEDDRVSHRSSIAMPERDLDIDRDKEKNRDPLSKKPNSVRSQELKQQIISVQPNIKNHFWQFENHRLFCGEPNSNFFLEKLPKEIALHLKFPPNNDESLAPKIINADSKVSLCSRYEDIDLKAIKTIVKTTIFELAPPQEIVVFSYIFDIEILKLAMSMDCYCWVGESNLTLCKQILDFWRSKGDVKRL